jgi:hypothetical protein
MLPSIIFVAKIVHVHLPIELICNANILCIVNIAYLSIIVYLPIIPIILPLHVATARLVNCSWHISHFHCAYQIACNVRTFVDIFVANVEKCRLVIVTLIAAVMNVRLVSRI